MAHAQTHGSCLQQSELGHTPGREFIMDLAERACQLNKNDDNVITRPSKMDE